MSSDHISGGVASNAKHKLSASGDHSHYRSKPMSLSRQDRPVPLASPSNSFASEDNNPMLTISLSSMSKSEVKNLKRKLTAELDEVRSLIKRLNPVTENFGSMANPPVIGRNNKLKTSNGTDKGTIQIYKKCNNLLTKLMKHKSGWVFNVPVDAQGFGLYDYHTIVTKPMDLGTVKNKLGKKLYNSPSDFAEDVRLTFNNALLYNPIGHDVHHMAEVLLNIFEEKWVSIKMQYDNLHKKLKPPVLEPLPAPTPSMSPPSRVLENITILVEAESVPSPPEGPVDSRDLTLDEKLRLSEELQDLPYEKLEIVVEIIKKRNPKLSQEEDEIELDIDSVDSETLWELYRFVTGYMESLSKKKEDHGFGTGHNIIQEPNIPATGTETSGVTESGKTIRKLSPGNNPSRSSSDSGSGSSDSDSDSSSGRGSDNGN